jgi:hypothetical protein
LSSDSSLFGAALEAELYAAQQSRPTEVDAAESEPPSKRARVEPSPQAAASPDEQPEPAAICPPHPGWLGGMCFRCGAQKPDLETESQHALLPLT